MMFSPPGISRSKQVRDQINSGHVPCTFQCMFVTIIGCFNDWQFKECWESMGGPWCWNSGETSPRSPHKLIVDGEIVKSEAFSYLQDVSRQWFWGFPIISSHKIPSYWPFLKSLAAKFALALCFIAGSQWQGGPKSFTKWAWMGTHNSLKKMGWNPKSGKTILLWRWLPLSLAIYLSQIA